MNNGQGSQKKFHNSQARKKSRIAQGLSVPSRNHSNSSIPGPLQHARFGATKKWSGGDNEAIPLGGGKLSRNYEWKRDPSIRAGDNVSFKSLGRAGRLLK